MPARVIDAQRHFSLTISIDARLAFLADVTLILRHAALACLLLSFRLCRLRRRLLTMLDISMLIFALR